MELINKKIFSSRLLKDYDGAGEGKPVFILVFVFLKQRTGISKSECVFTMQNRIQKSSDPCSQAFHFVSGLEEFGTVLQEETKVN